MTDIVERLREPLIRESDALHNIPERIIQDRRDAASEIERLRSHSPNPADHRYWEGRYRDEAAEVDRLKAEVERLRFALAAEREECAKVADSFAEVSARIDGGIAKSTTAAGISNVAAAIRART